MQSLMDWQSTTDSRILRQEEWQKRAQSTITQMVSQSRFNSFIASHFAETEQRALKALLISDFDSFVASRFSSREPAASQVVPWSEIDLYAAGMKKVGYKPAGDATMAPAQVAGVTQGAIQFEEETDSDPGGLGEAAKARAAKRAHNPSGSNSASSSSLLPLPVSLTSRGNCIPPPQVHDSSAM